MAAGGVGCASSCSCWAGRGATSGEGGGSWCRAALGKKIWLRRKWAKMLELESDTVCVLFIRKCAKSGERRSIADDVMWSVAVAEKNSVDALRGKRRCARETGGKLDGQWGGGDSEDARSGGGVRRDCDFVFSDGRGGEVAVDVLSWRRLAVLAKVRRRGMDAENHGK